MPNAIRETRVQFEQGWAEITKVYGVMLAPKTLTIVKGVAWNAYLRGRTDECARQLLAAKASAMLRRRAHVSTE